MKEEETYFITNFLNCMHKIGMPKEDDEILTDIADICAKKPMGDKYKDFVPTHSWFPKFCMRNKDIFSTSAKQISLGHASVTKEGIKAWFPEAANFISRVPGGAKALQDPKHIFNTDKSGFAMDVGTGCVKTALVPRGAHQVRKCARGTKEQVTINAVCNVAGDFMWPFLIIPGKIMSRYIGYRDFPEAFYGTTENGWMTMQAWNDWLYHFNEFINSRQMRSRNCRKI